MMPIISLKLDAISVALLLACQINVTIMNFSVSLKTLTLKLFIEHFVISVNHFIQIQQNFQRKKHQVSFTCFVNHMQFCQTQGDGRFTIKLFPKSLRLRNAKTFDHLLLKYFIGELGPPARFDPYQMGSGSLYF